MVIINGRLYREVDGAHLSFREVTEIQRLASQVQTDRILVDQDDPESWALLPPSVDVEYESYEVPSANVPNRIQQAAYLGTCLQGAAPDPSSERRVEPRRGVMDDPTTFISYSGTGIPQRAADRVFVMQADAGHVSSSAYALMESPLSPSISAPIIRAVPKAKGRGRAFLVGALSILLVL